MTTPIIYKINIFCVVLLSVSFVLFNKLSGEYFSVYNLETCLESKIRPKAEISIFQQKKFSPVYFSILSYSTITFVRS